MNFLCGQSFYLFFPIGFFLWSRLTNFHFILVAEKLELIWINGKSQQVCFRYWSVKALKLTVPEILEGYVSSSDTTFCSTCYFSIIAWMRLSCALFLLWMKFRLLSHFFLYSYCFLAELNFEIKCNYIKPANSIQVFCCSLVGDIKPCTNSQFRSVSLKTCRIKFPWQNCSRFRKVDQEKTISWMRLAKRTLYWLNYFSMALQHF